VIQVLKGGKDFKGENNCEKQRRDHSCFKTEETGMGRRAGILS
jgi:hypothetical protein